VAIARRTAPLSASTRRPGDFTSMSKGARPPISSSVSANVGIVSSTPPRSRIFASSAATRPQIGPAPSVSRSSS
jgi:hypothetical protein